MSSKPSSTSRVESSEKVLHFWSKTDKETVSATDDDR